MIDIPVIYEDDHIVAIDKPSGIVVNRAESVRGETIQDWAEHKLKIKNEKLKNNDENNDFYNRAGIVHRLDKDTSGLLIIAKTPQAFLALQVQFKERKVIKKYKTLVHGKVSPAGGEIRASVGRLPWNRERFGVLPGGRDALTKYSVIGSYRLDKNIFSLLEVIPQTGRTHQIRIHLKYMGYTVVGDRLYAGRKVFGADSKFCPRLFLHACFVQIARYPDGKPLEIQSELPSDLKRTLEKMSFLLS